MTYLEEVSGQVSEHEVQEILMDGSESEAHCDQSLHEDLKEKEDVEEYDADLKERARSIMSHSITQWGIAAQVMKT